MIPTKNANPPEYLRHSSMVPPNKPIRKNEIIHTPNTIQKNDTNAHIIINGSISMTNIIPMMFFIQNKYWSYKKRGTNHLIIFYP